MHRLRLRKMGKPWPWPVGAWEVGYAAWISCSSAPSSRGLLRCNRHPRKRTGKLGEIRYLVLFCCFVLLMLLSHGADMPIGSTISAWSSLDNTLSFTASPTSPSPFIASITNGSDAVLWSSNTDDRPGERPGVEDQRDNNADQCELSSPVVVAYRYSSNYGKSGDICCGSCASTRGSNTTAEQWLAVARGGDSLVRLEWHGMAPRAACSHGAAASGDGGSRGRSS
jgi:hypothetical protein